jgi:phospholipid/cholesterol/gamma-HCH transport system substrate-binding protein
MPCRRPRRRRSRGRSGRDGVVTQPLNTARLVVVTVFALTCFGLMLYLWNAFGGPVPLKPKGYRVTIALPEADLLTEQADVRISGVSVGRVVSTERTTSSTDPNRKDAVVQIDPAYAPLHGDVKAIIRRKSLAGEEYLELTPGSRRAPAVPDGGRLANANVAPSVEIDELLRLFDPPTRRRIGEWFQAQGASIDGRGAALNAAFGTLPGFEEGLTSLLTTLNRQSAALQAAVRNTGEVFGALGERRDALHGLIVNGRHATDAFAAQSRSFAETWRALPAFEHESRRLLDRAERFRRNADPVISALRPGFREFSATLPEAQALAPDLKGFITGVDGVTKAGGRGLPAARRFVDEARPLAREFVPFLAQFAPILDYVSPNADALSTLVANLAATTQPVTAGFGTDEPLHYARAVPLLNPTSIARYPEHRLSTNRSNAYPSATPRFGAGRPPTVFDTANCGPLVWPKLGPADPAAGVDETLIERIRHFAFNDDQPVAPPCVLQQTPGGTQFPRVQALSRTPGGDR